MLRRFGSTLLALVASFVAITPAMAQYSQASAGGTGIPASVRTAQLDLTRCAMNFDPMPGHTDCLNNQYGFVNAMFYSNLQTFTFQGGMFAASDRYSAAATFLTFIGTDENNDDVTSAPCALSVGVFAYCAFADAISDYSQTQVYKVRLIPSGGYSIEGDPNEGFFIGDELSFNAESAVVASPEPAGVVLVATGLVGVFGAARRRRRLPAPPGGKHKAA